MTKSDFIHLSYAGIELLESNYISYLSNLNNGGKEWQFLNSSIENKSTNNSINLDTMVETSFNETSQHKDLSNETSPKKRWKTIL